MSEEPGPFESIESAREFMTLLEDMIEDTRREVKEDLEKATADGEQRQVRALTLVMFKLNQLAVHAHKSGRILNDLRTVRRLLLNERADS